MRCVPRGPAPFFGAPRPGPPTDVSPWALDIVAELVPLCAPLPPPLSRPQSPSGPPFSYSIPIVLGRCGLLIMPLILTNVFLVGKCSVRYVGAGSPGSRNGDHNGTHWGHIRSIFFWTNERFPSKRINTTNANGVGNN